MRKLQKNRLKRPQRKNNKAKQSIFDSISAALPSLQMAAKIIEKVSVVGFQWPNLDGPIAKTEEEWREFRSELRKFEKNRGSLHRNTKRRMEEELGDFIFCIVNLAYFYKINPEQGLRGSLMRFERRFRFIEKKLKQEKIPLEEAGLAKMDKYWKMAKKRERNLH